MLTKNEFTKKLNSIKTHDERLHNAIASCIEYSIYQINEHGQLSPLNDLLAACGGLRTKLNKAVRRHVTVSNATYDKDANKFSKKTKGKPMKAKTREGVEFWESVVAVAPKRKAKATTPKSTDKANAPKATAPKASGAPRVAHASSVQDATAKVLADVSNLPPTDAIAALETALAEARKLAEAVA